MAWTVYMHTCPNGKKYVGITSIDPEKRWNKGNGYYSQIFYNAVKKYGWGNIKHEIIDVVETVEEAVQLEAEYIAKYNTTSRWHGYNVSPSAIACGGLPQVRHSEATRIKMSESAKRRKRVYTQEQIEKIKTYLKPKHIHDKRKWSKSATVNFARAKGVSIVQFDINLNPIGIWETAAQAWKETGINPFPSLYYKGRVSGGYIWKKASDLSKGSFLDFLDKKVPVHLLTGETIPLDICEV